MRSKIFTRTVGYWPLQESSGQAQDYSGNENHATTTQVTSYDASGPLGGTSMDFDGTDDHINAGDIGNLEGVFTVSMWIKTDTTTQSYPLEYADSAGSFPPWMFRLEMNNIESGSLEFGVRDGSDNVTEITMTLNLDNTWNHVVGIRNGTSVSAYLNGTKTGTGTIANTTSRYDGSGLFFIGRRGNGNNWQGKLAHVRVWDYPLTRAQIKALYNAAKGGYAESARKTV